jgi:hypothetical protein
VSERVWLERLRFVRDEFGADDCIYIKHTKVAEKDGAARHVRIL